MATAATNPKVVKTPEDHEQDTRVADRDRRVRLSVMAKVQTKNHSKVDIRPIGPRRFRVNVWQKTGDGVIGDYRIIETFVHNE